MIKYACLIALVILTVYLVHRMVTARKLARDSEPYIEQMPVAVISVNKRGEIVLANDFARKLWPMPVVNVFELTDGADSPFFLLRETLIGKVFDQDLSLSHHVEGFSPFFWVRTARVVGNKGELLGATFTAWILSESFLQEKQFTQREKKVIIGEMAAGTAHEIRNPLTTVRGLIQVLGERFDQKDPARQHISIMLSEIDQINHIIRELLLLTRRTTPNLSLASIPAILDHVLLLTEGQCLGQGISINKNYEANLPLAVIDEDQMKQVFLHLMTNAIQAMPGGGEITVAASYISADNVIIVKIKDTGLGIPAENLNRIFHPFFTTRPEGTGLGLPVSWQIIDNHGGKLSVQSSVGQGSTFMVALPLINYGDKKTS